MSTYTIWVNFKNGKSLQIVSYNTAKDVKDILNGELSTTKQPWLVIGDYFIVKDEILYLHVEGDKIKERQTKNNL